MGLDIYVGSLTRYYLGDWETIAARCAREEGMEFHVIRPNLDPADVETDPVIIGQAVDAWRRSLEAGLKPHLHDGLTWDERVDADYMTDKPDWVGYSGVVLLAAHTAHPEHSRPDRATAHWDTDDAYKHLAAQDFRCRFSQIFDVELWLPCPFQFTFLAESVTGEDVRIGSSVGLLEQLQVLNDETYRADAEELARWRFDGASSQDSFDQAAKCGLAMFLHHAQHSVERRLPMKLDY